MTTFALIPGAGGAGWLFHRVVPLLEAAGHEAIAIDLPAEDADAGLEAYAGIVADAVAGREDVVLVAQSLGGFTAPLAAARIPATSEIVLVNAMVPVPGETPGAWWGAVDSERARREAAEQGGYDDGLDLEVCFFHDVPRAVFEAGAAHAHDEHAVAFASSCAFDAWPDVPIHVVAGADDRFFPIALQRRVARERLGVEADVLPGGHLLPLSQPQALATYLLELRG